MFIYNKEPQHPFDYLVSRLAILFLGLMIAGAILCLSASFYLSGRSKSRKIQKSLAIKEMSEQWFERGPFSMDQSRPGNLLFRLREGLSAYPKNGRPDAQLREEKFHFLIAQGALQKEASRGEVLYLENRVGADRDIGFSQEPTEASLILEEWGTSGVQTRVQLHGKVAYRLNLSLVAAPVDFDVSYFALLREARWWGKDALVQHYGGRDYGIVKEKQKIEIPSERGGYACFVSPGDFLIWEDGKWKNAVKEKIPQAAPLAQIKAIGANRMDLVAWDEKGAAELHFSIAPQTPPRLQVKMESLFSAFRQKTATQYSCLLGKRRMVIKAGDWILRTPLGWHNLRRAQEIDDCFWHRIRGELLVIDAIEKEGGRWLLKGHLFDEMHTQVYNVAIPFSIEKKGQQRRKEQKAP